MRRHARRVHDEICFARAAIRSGLLGPIPPRGIGRAVAGLRGYGGLGGLFAMSAVRFGDRTAVIDERGELSFRALDERSNALANAWRAAGLQPGDGVALLVRNHRGFLEALAAAAKCGARILLLNTDFAGPQIREVVDREGIDLIVHDDEFTSFLVGDAPRLGRVVAWSDHGSSDGLDALIGAHPASPPPRPGRHARLILLTSGTTGTPKGAPRQEPPSLAPFGVILERVPFRGGEVREIAAPMFHALGLTHALLAIAMGSTVVLRRRFDAQELARSIDRNGSSAVVAVPVMMQRLLDLDPAALETVDLSRLRVVFVAGSQLGSELATRLLDRFGPVVYNLYGSTEVAYATIATPEDLRAAPACVGTALRGTTIRLYDDARARVPRGATGRIFVGSVMKFDGYTGGGTKECIDGLLASGDVGHFDDHGRLFIDGRDDDMIVSGGENVFPGEVEELLSGHPQIVEASVLGVPDERYGQRLAAFVVRRAGSALSEAEVAAYVGGNLARFKTPREIHFLDELPRNPTGKVIKRDLAATVRFSAPSAMVADRERP